MVVDWKGRTRIWCKRAVRLRLGNAIAAGLLLCACATQPEQAQRERRSESECPAFTRPDSVHRDGLTVRACSDRHGTIVCVEFGGRMHCREDDAASLINTG